MHRRTASLIAISLALTAAGGTGQAQTADALTIVSPEKIEVDPAANTPTLVRVRNASDTRIDVVFSVDLDEGLADVRPQRTVVASDSVKRVRVVIAAPEDLRTSGFLIVSAVGGNAARVPVVLQPAASFDRAASFAIFGPLAVAVALVGSLWLRVRDPWRSLTLRMGPVGWDVSKAWASGITVFGALVSAFLSAGLLPDNPTYAPKTAYVVLGLVFTIILVLGPAVYYITQRRTADPGKEPKAEGYVVAFLLTAMFVVWAVLGQLAILGLVLREIQLDDDMPGVLVTTIWVLVAVCAVAVAIYCHRTIGSIIESQGLRPKPKKPRTRRRRRTKRRRGGARTEGLDTAGADWAEDIGAGDSEGDVGDEDEGLVRPDPLPRWSMF